MGFYIRKQTWILFKKLSIKKKFLIEISEKSLLRDFRKISNSDLAEKICSKKKMDLSNGNLFNENTHVPGSRKIFFIYKNYLNESLLHRHITVFINRQSILATHNWPLVL